MVTPEEVKEFYLAVKLHFSSNTYHYGKFKGKVKKNNFSDIHLYSVIANGKQKSDFPDFFIPALFFNPKVSLTYFTTEDYLSVWRYWNGYQQSPKYFFEQECFEIKKSLERKNLKKDDLFTIEDQQIPLIYKMLIRNEIFPQTVQYLDEVLSFSNKMEKKVTEKIYFPKLNKRLKKISYFTKPQNRTDLIKIARDVFFT